MLKSCHNRSDTTHVRLTFVVFRRREPALGYRNEVINPEKVPEHVQIICLIATESCGEVKPKLFIMVILYASGGENTVQPFCGVCEGFLVGIVQLGCEGNPIATKQGVVQIVIDVFVSPIVSSGAAKMGEVMISSEEGNNCSRDSNTVSCASLTTLANWCRNAVLALGNPC